MSGGLLTGATFEGPPPRPLSELVKEAKHNVWKEGRDIKYWLHHAEVHYTSGNKAKERGDIESAFVLLSKAAILMMEKMPKHPEYNTRLNAVQRQNFEQNAFNLRQPLFDLKAEILKRHTRWENEERRRSKKAKRKAAALRASLASSSDSSKDTVHGSPNGPEAPTSRVDVPADKGLPTLPPLLTANRVPEGPDAVDSRPPTPSQFPPSPIVPDAQQAKLFEVASGPTLTYQDGSDDPDAHLPTYDEIMAEEEYTIAVETEQPRVDNSSLSFNNSDGKDEKGPVRIQRQRSSPNLRVVNPTADANSSASSSTGPAPHDLAMQESVKRFEEYLDLALANLRLACDAGLHPNELTARTRKALAAINAMMERELEA